MIMLCAIAMLRRVILTTYDDCVRMQLYSTTLNNQKDTSDQR
jgi:hypothetical protein